MGIQGLTTNSFPIEADRLVVRDERFPLGQHGRELWNAAGVVVVPFQPRVENAWWSRLAELPGGPDLRNPWARNVWGPGSAIGLLDLRVGLSQCPPTGTSSCLLSDLLQQPAGLTDIDYRLNQPSVDIGADVPSIDVTYFGWTDVKRLLGSLGLRVLRQVLDCISNSATALSWPGLKVEVRHTRDFEVNGWQYVLVVLGFNSTCEDADKHLHEFYGALDKLAANLREPERAILWRLLFFDVETAA